MSEKENADADIERLDKAVEALGEYFDTVQIFASRHESGESGGTVHTSRGGGNYFARFGHIRNWLIREEELTRIAARKSNPEGED